MRPRPHYAEEIENGGVTLKTQQSSDILGSITSRYPGKEPAAEIEPTDILDLCFEKNSLMENQSSFLKSSVFKVFPVHKKTCQTCLVFSISSGL